MTTTRTRREELELRRKLADQIRSELLTNPPPPIFDDIDQDPPLATLRWPRLLLLAVASLTLAAGAVAGLIAAMRWAAAKGWL
jgi:hypothetical protein